MFSVFWVANTKTKPLFLTTKVDRMNICYVLSWAFFCAAACFHVLLLPALGDTFQQMCFLSGLCSKFNTRLRRGLNRIGLGLNAHTL